MSGKTQSFEEAVLNTARAGSISTWTPFVGLFTTNPSSDADGGTEATGGSYARQACGFAAPAGTPRAVANASEILITMPACTVTGVGIWTLVSAGALNLWVDIVDKVFALNDQARFAPSALSWQED